MQLIIFLVMRRMRAPLIVLICAYAFAVLGFVLIPGQDDLGQPWQMSFFHAFYFVSFMGSTIGFGEIPYPFTDGQRLWAIITIYTTVISWLYAIGTLITLIQTPVFRAAVTRNGFVRKVQKVREPFYLICGYGDTGKLVVEALTRNDTQCVVVDANPSRINELLLEELPRDVPCLNADASESDTLLNAGLGSAYCVGTIAITRDDQVNLKIAIACKLLNRDVKVYCWAESNDTGVNMASFDTEHVIYPYDIFAHYLSNALSQPSNYLLHQWLSSPKGTPLSEPVFPPHGKWVLCGYGRFGKAVYLKLVTLGMPVTVIEERPDLTNPPEGSITGRGTEADTLELARVHEAVGIIAGTDHDVNNLSIILTAKAIQPKLFTVARQEFATNTSIFSAANIDLVTNHSKLISNELLALITTPLTADFLALSKQQTDEWSRILVCRLLGCIEDTNPSSWVITLRPERTKAFIDWNNPEYPVLLRHIMHKPGNRKKKLPCIALLLKRGNERILLPDPNTPLKPYDRILFAGDPAAESSTAYICTYPDLLHYMVTGESRPVTSLGKWLSSRTKSASKAGQAASID